MNCFNNKQSAVKQCRVEQARKMSSIDRFLGKKYKLKSSDNFENYLKFIEVGLFYRKTALSVSPTCFLTRKEDGSYDLTLSSTFRTVSISFRIGEEFVEERADGTKVKSLFTIDGDDLVQTQIENNGRKSTHVRSFTEESLTVVTTAEGWDGKCIRVYNAVN